MKRLFVIIGWELALHLKKRAFWLATFVAPLILSAIVLLPSFYYENSRANQSSVIGCVVFDTTDYCQRLSERLSNSTGPGGELPQVLIEPIRPDTTNELRIDFIERNALAESMDSLNEAYRKIQERRKYLFNRPESRTKSRLLSESYDQLISTREQRDLTRMAYRRLNGSLDSLSRSAALQKADSLLRVKRVAGYLLLDKEKFTRGVVTFITTQPMNFERIQPLKQALQAMLIEEQLRQNDIHISSIETLLQPIYLEHILIEGDGKREFNFMITYLSPVIIFVFLLISLLTTTRFLFNAVVSEKINSLIETIMSSAHFLQIITGKVLGIGILGLIQIIVWTVLAGVFILLDVIPLNQFGFITWHNTSIFVLYFSLGYLSLAAFLISFAAIAANETEAHRIFQPILFLILLPVVFIAFVLMSPNSMLIRFLSYLPFLAPSLMVLRMPFGEIPTVDLYVTIGILLAFIVIGFVFTAHIFRVAILNKADRNPIQRMVEILQLK